MPAVSFTTYSEARANVDADSDIAIYGPADYRVWLGDDLPDWHIPTTIEYPTAYAQQQHKQIVPVTAFGVQAGVLSDENSDLIQAAAEDTALNNQILWFPPGIYQLSKKLIIKDSMHLRGSGLSTRLEKHFTTVGTNAMLMPGIGASLIQADDVTFEDMEIGAVAHYIGDTKTNKLMIVHGNRWQLRNLKFKTWTGWAINVGGEDHILRNLTFEDPYDVSDGTTNGHDGLHIMYGNNIDVDGVFGVATDDFIAITNPSIGLFANRSINNVRIRNAIGSSPGARFIAVGSYEENSGPCSNISIVGAWGSTGGRLNEALARPPAILLFAIDAPLSNVEIRNFILDGSESDCGVKFAAHMGMENILFEDGHIIGGNIAIETDAVAISLQSGPINNLQFVNTIVDASSAKNAMTTPGAPTTDFAFDGYVLAGSDNVFNAFTVESSTAVRPIFNCDIVGIKTDKTGLNTVYASDAVITMRATKAEGATGTSGIKKTAQTINMTLVDSNFAGVDATYG